MSRLTSDEFVQEIIQGISGPKKKLAVKLNDDGKVTCINGVAYSALEIALMKLKRLEDMIDNGELVDITVFSTPIDTTETSDEEDTCISVCEEEFN